MLKMRVCPLAPGSRWWLMSGHLARWGGQGPRQVVCHHIGQPWHMQDILGAFSNKRQLALLPGRPWQ